MQRRLTAKNAHPLRHWASRPPLCSSVHKLDKYIGPTAPQSRFALTISLLGLLFPALPPTMVCKPSEIVFPPEPTTSLGPVQPMVLEGLDFIAPPIVVSPFCGNLGKTLIPHSNEMAGSMPLKWYGSEQFWWGVSQVRLDASP